MTERVWFLKQSRLFQQLSLEEIASLESRARVRELPPRQVIYAPSDAADSVFLVVRGRVRIVSLTPEGKEAILGLVEPGELFGEMALVSTEPREEHAETAVTSTVAALPRDALEAVMSRNSDLSVGVWKFIGWQRQRIERRLRSLLFRSTRERVLLLLVDLAEHYGRAAPQASGAGAVDLGIRLSHQEFANLIGATRESVTVSLGDLQNEGILAIGRQRVTILSLDRLARAAGLTRAIILPQQPRPPAVKTKTILENL